jgi:hypothetical protein
VEGEFTKYFSKYGLTGGAASQSNNNLNNLELL